MRAYISELRDLDQLRVIGKPVASRFELAAVTRACQQADERAVLFEQVHRSPMPVVTNLYGSRKRICALLGAEDGNFCRRWAQLMSASRDAAAVTETVIADDRISGKLRDLPQITYFEHDGGAYITSAIYLAKDPETGVPNLSFHRSMIVDDSELRVRLGSTHDLHHYYQTAEKLQQPLEAALLVGTSPAVFLAACASLPRGVSELQAAAAIADRPIPMQSCATIDVQFPADTEIVIEGRFLPNTLKPEGPFGEFMGYYVPRGNNHVFQVSAVSWRADAMFHSVLCGSPEDMYPLDYATAARIYGHLAERLPGIINVACYPYLMNTVVQIQQHYEGHARKVLHAAFAANFDYSKTCMVVDEDVDIYDLNDVWWAYLTRGRADTRALILKDLPGFYRDPHRDHWGRLGIDATMPLERREEFRRKRIPGAEAIDLADYR